ASLRLRVSLMTLGVADDILSILVLIVVYSAAVDATFVTAGMACLVATVFARRIRGPIGLSALLFAAAAWWMFARGGVEAAVVGVVVGVAGLAVSAAPARDHRFGPRAWERRLNPIVNLIVLPLFALANAGVDLRNLDLSTSSAALVFVAVLLARVVGKPLGVWLGASLLPSRYVSASGDRPPGRVRLGLGTVASVGFTVPLLIARVAFGDGALANAATTALLAGTVVGVALTAPLLRSGSPSLPR
ncbi:MAG: Na+/H+ antiporter NhaA, partial [Acidimicrobiia bacterium]|nr:Na+/H+ antiporter NhaA [Acidimicrobiia bacterium]